VAPVTTVKGDRITGEKSAHDSGYWMIAGFKQKIHVNVVDYIELLLCLLLSAFETA
jgi:hypothetical protein